MLLGDAQGLRAEGEVTLAEVEAGRYGGSVFLGRWEDLGLGAEPVVVLAGVEDGDAVE